MYCGRKEVTVLLALVAGLQLVQAKDNSFAKSMGKAYYCSACQAFVNELQLEVNMTEVRSSQLTRHSAEGAVNTLLEFVCRNIGETYGFISDEDRFARIKPVPGEDLAQRLDALNKAQVTDVSMKHLTNSCEHFLEDYDENLMDLIFDYKRNDSIYANFCVEITGACEKAQEKVDL